MLLIRNSTAELLAVVRENAETAIVRESRAVRQENVRQVMLRGLIRRSEVGI